MKKLTEILAKAPVISAKGDLQRSISGIAMDSRRIEANNCFVAISGYKRDGIEFLPEALKQGANSVVTKHAPTVGQREFIESGQIAWVQVGDDRLALSRLSAAFYDNPTVDMYTVGITGTNGKTTVMSLIAAIFNRVEKTAAIGTLGMNCAGLLKKSGLTTPEINDIFEFLAEVCRPDCRGLVMEASSVALQLQRLADIDFSQAIFTTFSGDHLDFHKTMADYFEAKMLLFKKLRPGGTALINVDDPAAPRVRERLKHENKYMTYGFSDQADVRPVDYTLSLDGIEARVHTPQGNIEIKSALIGRVNLSNILAAVASAQVKGISPVEITAGIKDFKAVKGRLDFAYKGDFSVLIDYAHTDKALEALLESLKELVEKRLIVVFGAGGSRDKTKRPRMGEAVSKHADFVVVTSDNPRDEDPALIIAGIVPGFVHGFKNFIVEIDREKAIGRALEMARPGDLVVIAGKGHEDYQIFRDRTIHFDDYEIVQKLVKK